MRRTGPQELRVTSDLQARGARCASIGCGRLLLPATTACVRRSGRASRRPGLLPCGGRHQELGCLGHRALERLTACLCSGGARLCGGSSVLSGGGALRRRTRRLVTFALTRGRCTRNTLGYLALSYGFFLGRPLFAQRHLELLAPVLESCHRARSRFGAARVPSRSALLCHGLFASLSGIGSGALGRRARPVA